jgi:hypothetical protein
MSQHLSELLRKGLIEPVPVLLGPRDQRFRTLYWTKDASTWWQSVSALPSRSLVSLPEQLNQAFADFIVGRPMTGMTKCDPPRGQGVWRLKTPDLRLYGWAPSQGVMIIAAGELKQRLAAPGPPKDRDLGNLVVAARKTLGFSSWTSGEIYHVFPRAPR